MTVIGGWAVHELVDPAVAQQSRDVDIVLHSAEDLQFFHEHLPTWKLTWRMSTLRDGLGCYHLEDETKSIVVDVFAADWFQYDIEGVPPAPLIKALDDERFLPSVEYLLADKIRTVPIRQGKGVYEKQAKDLLDIHGLVYSNRKGISPVKLATVATASEMRRASRRVPAARRRYPQFSENFDAIEGWLRTGTG